MTHQLPLCLVSSNTCIKYNANYRQLGPCVHRRVITPLARPSVTLAHGMRLLQDLHSPCLCSGCNRYCRLICDWHRNQFHVFVNQPCSPERFFKTAYSSSRGTSSTALAKVLVESLKTWLTQLQRPRSLSTIAALQVRSILFKWHSQSLW